MLERDDNEPSDIGRKGTSHPGFPDEQAPEPDLPTSGPGEARVSDPARHALLSAMLQEWQKARAHRAAEGPAGEHRGQIPMPSRPQSGLEAGATRPAESRDRGAGAFLPLLAQEPNPADDLVSPDQELLPSHPDPNTRTPNVPGRAGAIGSDAGASPGATGRNRPEGDQVDRLQPKAAEQPIAGRDGLESGRSMDLPSRSRGRTVVSIPVPETGPLFVTNSDRREPVVGQASRDPGPPGEGLGGFQVPSRLSTTTLPANLAADTSPGTGPGFGVDAASPRDPATSTNDGALLGQVSGPGAFGRPWISGLDEPGYVSTPSSPSGPAGREGFARAEGGTTDLGFGSAGTDGHESSPGLARIEAILQQVLDELRRKDADYLPIPSHLDYP